MAQLRVPLPWWQMREGSGTAQIDVAAKDGLTVKPWLVFLRGCLPEHLLLLAGNV